MKAPNKRRKDDRTRKQKKRADDDEDGEEDDADESDEEDISEGESDHSGSGSDSNSADGSDVDEDQSPVTAKVEEKSKPKAGAIGVVARASAVQGVLSDEKQSQLGASRRSPFVTPAISPDCGQCCLRPCCTAVR